MEPLSISAEVFNSITELELISDDSILHNCAMAVDFAVSKGRTQDSEIGTYVDELNSNLILNLSIFYLECARARATIDEIKGFLKDSSLSNSKANLIVEYFEENKERILRHLLEIGISFPSIVDIKWRLDCTVSSRYAGRSNDPMFVLQLQVKETDGSIRSIDMMATREELHDLLAKVRDAVKQVDRVLLQSSTLLSDTATS
eukprot:gene12438-26171_t